MKTKIIYKKGDACHGPELYLAHGCNNRGVMGSGIAAQIRAEYPTTYEFYRWNYSRSGLMIGDVIPFKEDGKTILNWITQNGYGRDGKMYVSYDAIKSCITKTNVLVPQNAKVAMPKIGAGLGGGDWIEIEKIIEENAEFIPVVYEL